MALVTGERSLIVGEGCCNVGEGSKEDGEEDRGRLPCVYLMRILVDDEPLNSCRRESSEVR